MDLTLKDLEIHDNIRMAENERDFSSLHKLTISEVRAITKNGASLLVTVELGEEWFPISQLSVDTSGNFYCTDWIWKQKS